MKWLVLVNGIHEVQPVQTTAMLIVAAARAGHDVFVSGVAELSLIHPASVRARCRRVHPGERASLPERIAAAPDEVHDGAAFDVVLIRTSPARDIPRALAHQTALDLVEILSRHHGVLVLNDPAALRRAGSKMYLSSLPPDCRPRTLISCDPREIKAFVRDLSEGCVLKPLHGTRGSDVFIMPPGKQENLNQILDVLLRAGGHIIAQAFVPEAAAGDTRIILLNGAPLVVDGHHAAVARVPGSDDFRSNVHVGARPVPADLTAAMIAIAERVAPLLAADGLFLTGIDLIGHAIVEVNVFSTGGLHDAELHHGVDFSARIIDAVTALVNARP